MSITLKQAKKLTKDNVLHHVDLKNADGTPMRWRVNGKVKTWKRSPERVKIPVKRGLYDYDYVDENHLHLVNLA